MIIIFLIIFENIQYSEPFIADDFLCVSTDKVVVSHSLNKLKRKGKFPCADCDRSYMNKCSLNRHIKLECGRTPRFECPHCSFWSSRQSALQVHMFVQHNVPQIVGLWWRLECNIICLFLGIFAPQWLSIPMLCVINVIMYRDWYIVKKKMIHIKCWNFTSDFFIRDFWKKCIFLYFKLIKDSVYLVSILKMVIIL